jgi:hypothetical protein
MFFNEPPCMFFNELPHVLQKATTSLSKGHRYR